MAKQVTVFGAKGMLGHALVPALEGAGWRVTGVDLDDGDIGELDVVHRLVADSRPDAVVNSAAYTNVDGCETEQATAYRVNAIGARNIAIAAREHGSALVHVSTDFVFDGAKSTPYVEDDPIAPQSIYGRSKAWGEDLVRSLCPRHAILRTQWLYGAGGKNFVDTMRRLFGERDELEVVADQIGCPTSTDELARAIVHVLDVRGEGTFHASCQGEVSWHGFARAIAEAVGYAGQVKETSAAKWNAPAPRPAYSALENRHFALTGGDPFRPWQDALADFLAAS